MFHTEPRLGKKKQLRLLTFFLAMAVASAFFVPFIIRGHGYFIFFGDFNVQQIPFYQYCHEMVRSGNFGWSFRTDLGANFIGSYSFYLLGSPFFWLTLPFPNDFVPYLMGPLLILKFSCAALTGYLFIRRFTARAESAVIGGLLYAFSGFSVYNIFFNHFHEAIVFFPLLLLAMELFLSEKRRGPLIFAVFLCVLSNYYFFFGMVVFVVIYWFVRMLSRSFSFCWSEFFLMLFECVLGVALAFAVLLPSVLEVVQNSRLSSTVNGWGAVLYGKEQIFLNVIECFFFPPDLPARPVFFPGADVKWSSLGGWLPLFGMTGTICWLLSRKKGTWLRRCLCIFAFMALVPGLNSAFSLFNTSYYARWFYMPILLMCLATVLALEDTEVNWDAAWRWSFGITLAFTAVIGFMPRMENKKLVGFGIYTDAATNPFKFFYQCIRSLFDDNYAIDGDYYDLRFWLTCLFAIGSLLAVRLMLPYIKEKKSVVFKPIIALVCIISVLYASFFIASGQSHSYDIDNVMIDSLIEGDVELDMGDFARIDVYDGVDNTGLHLGYPSMNFFHSIVPAGITEFYEYIGVTRTVGSRADADYYDIRPLLSVKYLLDPNISGSKEFVDDSGRTAMPGYTYIGSQDGYDIYENDNFLPMGFVYEYYMTAEQAEYFGKNRISEMMLKAMLVEKEDVPKAAQYLKNADDAYNILTYSPSGSTVLFSETAFAEDCDRLRTNTADRFVPSRTGFTSQITLEKENLVFYSVPYHDGWTAYVNGRKTDIIKANKGFMAVAVPAGTSSIEFCFETPGLKIGLLVTAVTAAVILIYLAVVDIKRRVRPATPAEYPEGERIADHAALYEAAVFAAENPEDDSLLAGIDPDSIEAYSGFEGGFVINDSVLDSIENDAQGTNEGADESEPDR